MIVNNLPLKPVKIAISGPFCRVDLTVPRPDRFRVTALMSI